MLLFVTYSAFLLLELQLRNERAKPLEHTPTQWPHLHSEIFNNNGLILRLKRHLVESINKTSTNEKGSVWDSCFKEGELKCTWDCATITHKYA